ncbi:MAG: hypothetical protein LBJ14_05675 [Desulfarculales bacterium]|jgi:hypothetical protein|nr:hypothetical protein [Desulfarculales bacterium]
MTYNLLKTCLKIRGIKNIDIAKLTGFHPSYVQKIICGNLYTTLRGPHVWHNRKIEEAISHFLGLTHEQTWGEDAAKYLKLVIEQTLQNQMYADSLREDKRQVNVKA